jgi:hypothetical protein
MYIAKCWDGDRFVTAVVQEGRKLTHFVSIESTGVRVHSLPIEETRNFKKVTAFKKEIEYPVARACRKMLDAGKRLGITAAAKTILKEGLSAT